MILFQTAPGTSTAPEEAEEVPVCLTVEEMEQEAAGETIPFTKHWEHPAKLFV